MHLLQFMGREVVWTADFSSINLDTVCLQNFPSDECQDRVGAVVFIAHENPSDLINNMETFKKGAADDRRTKYFRIL